MINSSILANLPKNPGCYLFKDNSKKIIYIGKAKNIKKRVSSYFQKKHDDKKTLVLVTKIAHIDFVITDSEVEALLLENNLIKKHKPKYNIDLKDSKRYAFIQITDEEFPRILLARTRSPNKSADNSINKNSLLELEKNVLLFYIGKTRNSSNILENQIKLIKENNPETINALHYVKELSEKMIPAWQSIWQKSKELKTDLRTAAFIVAIQRIEAAMKVRN